MFAELLVKHWGPKIWVRISSTFSVLRPFAYTRPLLYFDRSTSTSVLRHFVKSGGLIGQKVQVEVQFW